MGLPAALHEADRGLSEATPGGHIFIYLGYLGAYPLSCVPPPPPVSPVPSACCRRRFLVGVGRQRQPLQQRGQRRHSMRWPRLGGADWSVWPRGCGSACRRCGFGAPYLPHHARSRNLCSCSSLSSSIMGAGRSGRAGGRAENK
ncbi:hypothetical protein I4F81_009701 [Pyropia yezoensis]|uniref:Uncharacterized protein n=1 Tax=Pyropia yezoensis TaxID=2788 RepID=A0ACC3CBG9_PYRYE|nr:hypothetical protein I4F81_009701 [Neopyropia yezoensis]